ncbi:MAG: hypothetical protein HQM10_21340 [Candidatus Riflebacteria bacterium]|nr:hypothetical protein [Candidatus Riflebacteria bacterium]
MAEEVIKEGKWICPNCAAKNRGLHIECPSCGAARGNVQFIYDENASAIVDEDEKKQALSGPDWICAYCETSNKYAAQQCKQCQAEKAVGKSRQERDLNDSKPDRQTKQNKHENHVQAKARPIDIPEAPNGYFKFGCIAIILLFSILAGLQCYKTEMVLDITDRSWERSFVVQEYKTLKKGDWVDKVSSKARISKKERKQRTTKQVQVGTKSVKENYTKQVKVGTKKVKTGVKDLGNGSFKEIWEEKPVYEDRDEVRTVSKPVYEDQPVYDTWAEYEIDDWDKGVELKTSGGAEDPYWPKEKVADSPRERIGEKRAVQHKEMYKLVFSTPDKKSTYDVDKINSKPIPSDLFIQAKIGTKWKALVSGLGLFEKIEQVK